MSNAVLIIGELRFKNYNHFNKFIKIIKGYDVYISTSSKYIHLGEKIKPKFINIISENIKVKANNMYQWYHLDQIIKQQKQNLLKYENIIKIRTDINIEKLTLNKIESNVMYTSSDILFYAESNYFINVFQNFYNLINDFYWNKDDKYFDINYDNILQSELYMCRLDCVTLPKIIHINLFKNELNNINFNDTVNFNYNLTKLKKNIIKYKNILDNKKEWNEKESISFQTWKSPFASEKIFILHILNYGKVLLSRIKSETNYCKTYPNRKKWEILN